MKTIHLTRGKQALVDDQDYEWLSQWKWLFDGNYARRSVGPHGKQKAIWMHRLIMNCPEDKQGDHINGDKLDNRRANLRTATRAENGMNRKTGRNNKIGIKGVSRFGNKWRAYIGRQFIGYFSSKEQAGAAYDQKAKELYGEFARLNNI